METKAQTIRRLEGDFSALVVGRKIMRAGYANGITPFILLDDGTHILIQSDDEGNGAGVPVAESMNGDKSAGLWNL